MTLGGKPKFDLEGKHICFKVCVEVKTQPWEESLFYEKHLLSIY